MSNSSPPKTTIGHFSDIFKTGNEALGNYKGATGNHDSGLFDTLKFAYEHRNETLLGINTYGVKPFSYPVYTKRLYSNLKTLQQQGNDTVQHISKVYDEISQQPGWND